LAAEALHCYERAAEQGHVEAQVNARILYARGEGVERDLLEARKWLQRAADLGYPRAMLVLEQYAPVLTPTESQTTSNATQAHPGLASNVR